ncbi:hypothetical protein [Streptacidiphilus jiangxiensis]|uniref:Uncharacterized protein n=1 Tax=Streptacidiphilus jiangxiensis TaxID=235985 RepID=A0A1H8BGI7_STRJI|nr:hypothetical protein [Streptacidiphilus jiangxiensis]SEM81866.1 hypothetical protein SAMN05414137_1656 [Streptacidiphilus jiangxiensis]
MEQEREGSHVGSHDGSTPAALRLALRTLPRSARAAQASELAAIFAEATAGRGRAAVLREAADVAGHGLRLRVGLGGRGRADGIVAKAAPLAVSLCVGQGVLYVVALVVMLMNQPQFDQLSPSDKVMLVGTVAATAVWLVVLTLLLVGRWGAARVLASAGVLGQAGALAWALPEATGSRSFMVGDSLLPSLFVWVLLLAVPRDMAGPVLGRDRGAAAGIALLSLLPYGLMLVIHYPNEMALAVGFMWVLPMLLALALARRGGTGVAAFGLASVAGLLRFGVPTLASLTSPSAVAAGGVVLVALAAAWRSRSLRAAERRAVGS